MLPLPTNILTGFGSHAEDILLGIYKSLPNSKQCSITSADLILGLAIRVEKLLRERPLSVEEAIREIFDRQCTEYTSNSVAKMCGVIIRGRWVHELVKKE